MFLKTLVKFSQSVLFSAAALFCAVSIAQSVDPKPSHEFTNGKVIANRYIVTFRSNVANPVLEADNLMQGRGGQIHFRFNNAIKGFAATIPAAAINSIRNNPNVESIELDAEVKLNQVASPQNQVTWGLDRVDQRDRPLDTQYYFQYNGSAVTAFVIDTGIRSDHIEFVGRIVPGYTAVSDGNGTNDCNGHGTHVSGTIGRTTWGVAKAVKLAPVRVLDCAGSGTLSGVIAGIDWVAGSSARPAVANLSLGSSKSSTVNAAVAGAYNKGVTMVVAAGNSNADACLYSPSSEPTAITVGATTSSDARASYSNYGTCVDVFAPGSSITSAWNTSSTATNTISGTSMASPHVAGIAALALSASPSANPSAVAQFILSNSSLNKVSSIGTGSPNKLAYSMASGEPGVVQVQTVAIKSLIGSAKKAGKTWQAKVTVTVRDINSGANVPYANVTSLFSSGGASGCTTSSNGSCTMTSGSIATSSKLTTYAVNGLSGNNLSYDPTQNTATQITVAMP
jgi:subtilisin family serine protease